MLSRFYWTKRPVSWVPIRSRSARQVPWIFLTVSFCIYTRRKVSNLAEQSARFRVELTGQRLVLSQDQYFRIRFNE
ncbi:hypothetical protein HNR05_002052 [Leifsonia psychrotolerans]|uniref:Uncharacterized protein n=1 Tax=Glaciibacter psychrotolerans TaxID=670054 RepID=A0A7Z0EEU5_9MICO|nr:hypothetical protein [Leifsonia psychrotolerans]